MLYRSLYEYLKRLPDNRIPQKVKHEQAAVLTYIIMGFLCGKITLRRVVIWANRKYRKLKKWLPLKEGIASISTVSRILSGVETEDLIDVFCLWAQEIYQPHGKQVIIDGKAIRAATKKKADGKTPYILNAIDAMTQLVIAQIPIEEKENEIVAIPKILDMIPVKGNMITIDAIGTQVEIIRMIQEKEGYYLLQVKCNQQSINEEVLGIFREYRAREEKYTTDDQEKELKELKNRYDVYETTEKNRGRIEYRKMESLTEIAISSRTEVEFEEVVQVGLSTSVRIQIKEGENQSVEEVLKKAKIGEDSKDEVQVIPMISNKKMSAKEMAEIKRKHWLIENGLHYVLDNSFREDRSRATKGKDALCVVRKFAYNILRIHMNRTKCKDSSIAMDDFDDDFSLLEKYIFEPIVLQHK